MKKTLTVYDLIKGITKKSILPILILLPLSVLATNHHQSQKVLDKKVSLALKNVPLSQALKTIETVADIKFVYSRNHLNLDEKVTLVTSGKKLGEVLDILFVPRDIKYVVQETNDYVVLTPVQKVSDKPSGGNASRAQPLTPAFRIITGTITDENGAPLPGANIMVKGTAIGTTSDADGNYGLSIPSEATTLLFSYIGYVTEEVEIAGRSVIDMVMLPDVTALEEITVSTGYWEVEERLNPGNIAKIDAKVIGRQPVVNPLLALQGQVSGVFITQNSGIPGDGIDINIRGLNSLNDGNDGRPNANLPFYVVDGIPYSSSSLNSNRLALNNGNPLAVLRPSDIESIEVLKDADATAIYGSRGANGVILITTKKGQAGKTRTNLEFSRGIGEMRSRLDLLKTDQYLTMRREAIDKDGQPLSAIDSLTLVDLFVFDPDRNVDWQEELLSAVADQTRAGIAVSGGTSKTQFLFSSNYFRQTNIFSFDDSAFDNFSGRVSLNHSSQNNKFNGGITTTYSIVNNNQNGVDFASEVFQLAPNAPVLFDENGNLNFENNFDNPLAGLISEYENRTKSLITNITMSYELIPNLTLKSALGYTTTQIDEISIRPLSSISLENRETGGLSGSSTLGNGSQETWILEPMVTYEISFGKSSLNLIAGSTLQSTTTESLSIWGRGYENDILLRDINAAPIVEVLSNSYIEYNYTAVFTRLNYNWDSRYILNITGRRDGSSRFGPGNRFGNFWAIGTAWIFSKESFVSDNLAFLSFGKLRGSFGLTGNDQIGNYQYLDSYTPTSGTYNGQSGLVSVRASNPDYSWETNEKLEIGLELGFLNDRMRFSTSWFRNQSSNQLIGQPLSLVTGFSNQQFNLPALVENSGIEIEFTADNIVSKEFTWHTNFNFSRLRNELVAFPDIENFSPFDNRYEVGQSLFGSKQFQSLGVDRETGEYALVDVNNDGIIDLRDQQDFVERYQDFFGGVNNTLRWKGIQFDIFFSFVKQNARNPLAAFSRAPGDFSNQPVEVLNRWQNPGDATSIQRFTRTLSDARLRHYNSSAGLVDASFIRLQNVALTWTIPYEWTEKLKIGQANIYVQGQNIWTITRYNGLDPETLGLTLPPLRIITTGIQLSL